MVIGPPPSAVPMTLSSAATLVRSAALRSRRMPLRGLALDEGVEAFGHFGLAHPLEAVGSDRRHRRVDAPHHVGPTGGRVLVGRLVEAVDGQLDAGGAVDVGAVAELDRGAGVPSAGPGGVELGLFVAPTGDVVLEDAAQASAQVEAGEDRD